MMSIYPLGVKDTGGTEGSRAGGTEQGDTLDRLKCASVPWGQLGGPPKEVSEYASH